MTDFIDRLMQMEPQLETLGMRRYIGESLATNCSKGLNGKYATRLREGIRVATSSPSDQLVDIIERLLDDRRKHDCTDRVDIPVEVESQRVLILALWTNRRVHLGRNGGWQTGSTPCYGNETYMPPLNQSYSSATLASQSSSKSTLYQPTEEDVERILEMIDPHNTGASETALRYEMERDAKEKGKKLCPDWWENLQAKREK